MSGFNFKRLQAQNIQENENSMTIPLERTRAVNLTRDFLYEIINTELTHQIIRERARALLKHYPVPVDLEIVVEEGSSVFGDEQYPLGTLYASDSKG
jgi:hypothetical protein